MMISVRSAVWMATGAVLALVSSLLITQAWSASAAPGDDDATFVPITACRLVDTRPAPLRVGTFGAFGIDDTKTIQARGTNGDCTIPSDAVGVSLNVTAVDASQATFLTIWPDGTKPTASSLNPTPGQPPTPNAVTTLLSSPGAFKVFNRFGTVEVIIDVNGYYTKTSLEELADDNAALQSDVTALQSDVADLEALLASMSLETVDGQRTVRFTDVNVQIVDGSGNTFGDVNGRGNLIVGYNENLSDTRTGSHNLVVGDRHSYSSYGGLVAGTNNTISGEWSSVSGGAGNTASGLYSSVSGGGVNTAGGDASSVSGGVSGSAPGTWDWRAGSLFEDG